MSLNTYDIGDRIRISCAFTVAGIATDPTTITLRIKTPDGVVTVYTYAGAALTRSGTGVYFKDLDTTMSGIYFCRWECTGAAVGAEESVFVIRVSSVVPG